MGFTTAPPLHVAPRIVSGRRVTFLVSNGVCAYESVCGVCEIHKQTSVLVNCALDGILRRSLGNGSIRAARNLKVGDVSGANVIDEAC